MCIRDSVQIIAPTVEADVAFGPVNLGLSSDAVRRAVKGALGYVGLDGYERRPPHHLSGGEKKRVAIAGILAMDPAVLVFDEPTNTLDPASSEPRRVEQRISRLQFATSFAEASLALQAATIAAETGEALQQSPYVSNRGRVWADIRALAAQTNPRLAQRPSFQQFLELVDLAERVRAKQ